MLVALGVVCGFLAGLVQGFSGFGFAIFTMSFLTLLLPLAKADRMVCIMATSCIVMMAARLWRHIDWPRLPWVGAGVGLGVPIGVTLGPHVPEHIGKPLLGLIVIAAAVQRFRESARPKPDKEAPRGPPEVGYGVAAGLLYGWVNMSGPPLVYWAHHSFKPTRARALLAGAFVFASVFKITSLTAMGLWIPESVVAGLCAMPTVFLGTWLGDRIARRFKPEIYARWIWGLFMALGVLLVVMPVAEAAPPRPDSPPEAHAAPPQETPAPPPSQATP
jgi:hypothetical protein